MSEWISVDERLPDSEGMYLTTCIVFSHETKVKVGVTRFVVNPAYKEFKDGDWVKTTHWMPLPKPAEK